MSEIAEIGSRPLRKDAARNRAALLATAREVFAERGLDVSLDDIARDAGVGVGTAYRHFSNKYELARAILRESVDEIVQLAFDCAAADDAWTGLATFLEESCCAQASNRGLHEILMGLHDAELADDASERLLPALQQMVDRAHHAGQLPADVDVTDIGIALVCLSTIAEITGEVAPELWRRYVPMLLDGLRSGTTLPVPPISSELMRSAFARYKQRQARIPR